MNGLKNSLEAAIKEMQALPATPRINPAMSGHVVPGQRSFPEHSGQSATGQPPAASQRIPAAGSIEAALASAPSVSPHYVPPVRPVHAIEPSSTTSKSEFSPQQRVSVAAKPVLRDRGLGAENPAMKSQPESTAASQQNNKAPSLPKQIVPVPRSRIAEKPADFATAKAEPVKRWRDGVWRWATIGISCAGGLASGWLGSNMTDPGNGLVKAGMQTIVGKASQNTGENVPPVGLKMARDGVSKGRSEATIGELTGKTDRAVATDENLCTVLELDRGTGLTLAKPCKPVLTAEINSTLGKSDLLARPK